jgi:hypothetical protein
MVQPTVAARSLAGGGRLARHSLTRTLAGTGIGVGALPVNRETFAVTQATVATKVHQALDVESDVAAQVAFDLERRFKDVADASDFIFADVVGALFRIDLGGRQNLQGCHRSDAVQISERDTHFFVAWKIDASNTSHSCLQNLDSSGNPLLIP